MKRSFLLSCFCFFALVLSGLAQTSTPAPSTSSTPPNPPAPRCIREACSAALKGYKGPNLNACHGSYVQLNDKSTEAWLVVFDGGESKVYRIVDAKTGEILPDVDAATVKKCGPRPFNCPGWVYQPCPASEDTTK